MWLFGRKLQPTSYPELLSSDQGTIAPESNVRFMRDGSISLRPQRMSGFRRFC
jgi:hypothetical protein